MKAMRSPMQMNANVPATEPQRYSAVQTLSLISGKGGDGRTTLALNLAVALARSNSQVVLFDANLSLGNLDLCMNVRQDFSIADVVANDKDINEVVVRGPHNIMLVPSPHGDPEMSHLSQIQHNGIINSFSNLTTDADIMLIDNEAGISRSVVDFTHAAREVLLVVCDEPASLQNAFATIKALSASNQCYRFRVIANKVDSSQHGLEVYSDICRRTDRYLDVLLEYCGAIPFDPALVNAARDGKAVVESQVGSKSARSIEKLAAKIKQWPKPLEPKGQAEFFVERLV